MLFTRLASVDLSLAEGDIAMDDALVKKHALVVMEALGAAVECLDDSLFLSNVLVALGQIHFTYQVRPHYLQVSDTRYPTVSQIMDIVATQCLTSLYETPCSLSNIPYVRVPAWCLTSIC